MSQAQVERARTSEYPTRFVAFEKPGILWENVDTRLVHPKKGDKSNTTGNGGREFAVYYEPRTNMEFPYITDGIYAEIISYQGIFYQAEIHATRPYLKRGGLGDIKQFKDYDQAVEWLLAQIPHYQEWVRNAVPIGDLFA